MRWSQLKNGPVEEEANLTIQIMNEPDYECKEASVASQAYNNRQTSA